MNTPSPLWQNLIVTNPLFIYPDSFTQKIVSHEKPFLRKSPSDRDTMMYQLVKTSAGLIVKLYLIFNWDETFDIT